MRRSRRNSAVNSPGWRRTARSRANRRAPGLGFVAANFDAIDAARRGTVRFEDLKRFLKERGARLPE